MRALVTGAGGFIGGHVTRALLASGADVRGLDRDAGRVPVGAEPIAGDVLDPAAVRRALDGCDAVFHLAAVYSYARADAAAMQAVNVEGTRCVLDAAARTGVRVVHTSSCATCGPVPGRAADEDDTPPAWELAVPYKRTKHDGERLALAAAAEGHDVVVVNPTTPVGPGDHRPTPTGRMIRDVASGRARAYLAGGALNVVAVQDVAAGHLRALEHGRSGRRYLLGGEDLAMRDVFAAVARAAGRPAPRLAVPWGVAYGAARVADAALRPLGREPRLLVLDEVRLARVPMRFDDRRAREELGHVSRPAAQALAEAVAGAAPTGLRPPAYPGPHPGT
ncbi:NAD-dependent epimerase/dehydratase family protein [Baekduia soli]|uniref:NAD-dependent epimerase/dehydratase family protein n=1 Tax=Baekduia soli TaxID=496014 RepID=A0A5B8U147_9ACTN|nr:NAD-dependent epimerase/dehydratase family protein [Baekduia soli]QEC46743.1 NAD-dependent epimerase/dehydratase family protein [Baekduia soli]